jgi:hypothetical protein
MENAKSDLRISAGEFDRLMREALQVSPPAPKEPKARKVRKKAKNASTKRRHK